MPELEDGSHTKDISDGYHTFGELYEWRHALFLLALRFNSSLHANELNPTWWTSKHHPYNDPMFEVEGQPGILVGLDLPPISVQFHMPARYIEAVDLWATEIEHGPVYSGTNDPKTTLEILKRYVGLM